MTVKNLIKDIENQLKENESLKHARKIAASIIVKLKITEGVGLPFLLDQPKARNNEETVLLLIVDAQDSSEYEFIPFKEALSYVESRLAGIGN